MAAALPAHAARHAHVCAVQIVEAAGWVGFVFLEVYPHVASGSVYDTRGWALTVKVWEAAILLLFGFPGSGLVWSVALLAAVLWRVMRKRGVRRRKRQPAINGIVRDLDV